MEQLILIFEIVGVISFALSGAQMPVLRMERREASLEDVFIRLTADDAPAEKEGGEA